MNARAREASGGARRGGKAIQADPLVSVVVATHNRAPVLMRALKSVLQQSYTHLEAVVVDDASTDDTWARLQAVRDPRLRLVKNHRQLGCGHSRNLGIAAAKGSYIAFQDSDDQWHPTKLRQQMDAFACCSQQVGVVYSGFHRIQGSQRFFFPSRPGRRSGNVYTQLLRGNMVATQTAVVRRVCLQESGLFDRDLCSCVDWDLFLRVAKKWLFYYVPKSLVTVYTSRGSVMTNRRNYVRGFEHFLNKHLADYQRVPYALWRHYYDVGTRLLGLGEFGAAAAYLWRVVQVWNQM